MEDYGDNQVENLYSTHKRSYKDKSIGITTINSAWRANDSNTDTGNLLYPLSYIKKASEEVKPCDLKILMLHHPLADFKWWNKQKLEDLIYKDYHLLFSGHVHSNRDTLHITSDMGIYHSTSRAALSSEKDKIGFTILDVDIDSFELQIQNVLYDTSQEEFYYGEPIPAQIPISKEKQEQNKFRKTLRKRFNEKLDESNKLFLSYKDLDENNNFLILFTAPVIKNNSQSNPKSKTQKRYGLSEIILGKDKNQLIFGKDKSGKSAILYKMTLDILNQFNEVKILPIYIDCNSSVLKENKLDIISQLAHYYELSKANASSLSKKYHIKILLDNFNENEELILEPLKAYKKSNPNSSIVATANQTLFTSFTGGLLDEIQFESLYIHDITRTEIRSLTNKWPNISNSKKELVLEKIQTVFNQLNIPSNYWTVSLFIWIFEKNIDVNFGNNFQLINLYVDNLLDRDRFILANKYKIDFNDLKDFLGDFAHYLVTNKYTQNYCVEYSELIKFTENYKSANKRFIIDTEEITQLIISKGIIRKGTDGLYTFRLNGVFEYFLGYYMASEVTFRNKIIDDGHFYLSFQNEFEVCAGLIPQNQEFVEKIFDKTKLLFEETNKEIDFMNIDSMLISKVSEAFNLDSGIRDLLRDNLGEPLESDKQDSILESLSPSNQRIAEVKPKKYYESIGSNLDDLEKALYILGRVFRNSKLKKADLFNNRAFDFILNSTCSLSLSLIEEIDSQNLNDVETTSGEDQLIRLLTEFMPIVAQTFFYDIAIQVNLENILKEKINELCQNKKGNELKLLILYFSLIDLDLKGNEKFIQDVIEEIDIPILRQTTLFKLYLYLSFKVNNNKSLKEKIAKYIKKQELKIDSTKSIGSIEQQIAKINKSNLRKGK